MKNKKLVQADNATVVIDPTELEVTFYRGRFGTVKEAEAANVEYHTSETIANVAQTIDNNIWSFTHEQIHEIFKHAVRAFYPV